MSSAKGISGDPVVPLDDTMLFFDLAGTLLEPDADLTERRRAILQAVGQRAGRIVLVTGQPLDDPQVEEILAVFTSVADVDFVAYVTRGGLRLEWHGGALRKDPVYWAQNRLADDSRRALESEINHVLAESRLKPLIPVKCLDDVAIRINLTPSDRPRFQLALAERLTVDKMQDLQVVIEGRTSVFVTKRGVGKRQAIEYELARAKQEGTSAAAFFFGNEFDRDGNDHEVLGVTGLEICAVGPYAPESLGVRCHTIGQTPDDLYSILQSSLASSKVCSRALPVVCLSLGGTRMEVGLLTWAGVFVLLREVHWRNSPRFASLLDDLSAVRFCEAVSHEIVGALGSQGYRLSDVDVLGVAFPGPKDHGLWYSNNLIRAFEAGVDVEAALTDALLPLSESDAMPQVRVVFDAQCDAGGELYHPAGRLSRAFPTEPVPHATVLNIATGIAAGLIRSGEVLLETEDFRCHVASEYDGGAGQLGRHLWYHPKERCWTYRFCAGGKTPAVSAPAVRMTDRLSGPALAARLLLLLGGSGCLPTQDMWTETEGCSLRDIVQLHDSIARHDLDRDASIIAREVRRAPRSTASALLTWADRVYADGEPAHVASCICSFAFAIATELAQALKTWLEARGWAPFARHIVLTGGVGIRFLASSDSSPDRSFLDALASGLPSGCRVERSRLLGSAERECGLFLRQPRKNGNNQVVWDDE